MLKDLLLGLWQRRNEIDNQAAHDIVSVIINLLVCLAGEQRAPGEAALASQTGKRQARQSEILAYINANLSSPALNVQTIASAFKISTRHLRKLLDDRGITPASHIQQLRLQQARDDLLNPLLKHLSITEIAFRWGYNSLAHFSRLFQARYQSSPRQLRQLQTSSTKRKLSAEPLAQVAGSKRIRKP